MKLALMRLNRSAEAGGKRGDSTTWRKYTGRPLTLSPSRPSSNTTPLRKNSQTRLCRPIDIRTSFVHRTPAFPSILCPASLRDFSTAQFSFVPYHPPPRQSFFSQALYDDFPTIPCIGTPRTTSPQRPEFSLLPGPLPSVLPSHLQGVALAVALLPSNIFRARSLAAEVVK